MRRTGSCIGKYESPPNDDVDGSFRRPDMRGNTRSSSSVDASAVSRVGLINEAADDAGSMDAILLRIEGMDTRDNVRNGHDGGESGDTGLWMS